MHVGCHGCSRYGGCNPGRGRAHGGQTVPAAAVCRQAVEGRTGQPGRMFPAAPWEHDNTPLPAAGSMEKTRSPLLLSTPPEKTPKRFYFVHLIFITHHQSELPHLPSPLVCLCLERECPVWGRCVQLGTVGQSENHRTVQQHAWWTTTHYRTQYSLTAFWGKPVSVTGIQTHKLCAHGATAAKTSHFMYTWHSLEPAAVKVFETEL